MELHTESIFIERRYMIYKIQATSLVSSKTIIFTITADNIKQAYKKAMDETRDVFNNPESRDIELKIEEKEGYYVRVNH